MKLVDTKDINNQVNLNYAILNPQPQSMGLYLPENIQTFDDLSQFKNASWDKTLSILIKKIFFDRPEILKQTDEIINALNFPPQLINIEDKKYIQELFHGPTLAFKDYGAIFMAELLKIYSKKKTTILTATSGDTGSAVANAFNNNPDIQVAILFPEKGVSALQKKLLTCWGDNIFPFEIEGDFDNCQAFVKKAFQDKSLLNHNLTTANSINIARLLPQIFYYFFIYSQLNEEFEISVPCGNLGNLTAGVLAKKMGLPIKNFIASTNANKVLPTALETGVFTPSSSIKTLSNAMDVGNPSNYQRLFSIYNNDLKQMGKDIIGVHYTDDQTKEQISYVFKKFKYIIDPHSAISYKGLEKSKSHSLQVALSTAHPIKFSDPVEKIISSSIPIPKSLKNLLGAKFHSFHCPNDYEEWKSMLMNLIN